MRKTILTIITLIAITGVVSAQSTFMIGMTHNYYATANPSDFAANFITTSTYNGGYSSANNVLTQDGFNLAIVNWPDAWTTQANYFNLATLLKRPDINMKLCDAISNYYKPTGTTPSITGENIYHTVSTNSNLVGFDYDWLYSTVYSDPVFYSHGLGTEFVAFHYYPVKGYTGSWCDAVWKDCGDLSKPANLKCEPLPGQSSNFIAAEVAPQYVSDAIYYFKNTYPSITTPLNLGVATHNAFLSDNNVEACFKGSPYFGRYNTQNYVDYSTITQDLPGVTNPHYADLIYEDSYYNSVFKDWAINNNYLGKFINIDYLHQKGYSRIMSENDIAAESNYELHSNPNIPNANMLRFLTYTAIIHGIEGIGFYSLPSANAYDPEHDIINVNFDPASDNGMDKTRYLNINNPNLPSRFARTNFPYTYQTFVSNLTRELRYLANNNFIVANNATGVLYKKLASTSADPNNIVEPSANYLPATINAVDIVDYNLINSFPSTNNVTNNKRGEDHGIRYLITTNANGEAIMIASNPNPYSVHNVDFNFSGITHTAISNAIAVDVLFDDGSISNVNSTSYKTNTSPTVEATTFALIKNYTIQFCGNHKQITTDFGPFDIKIFNFKKSLSSTPNYANGWQNTWNNGGNNMIGSWGGWNNSIKTDKFIAIDFNKDGSDELLCVQDINSDGPSLPAQDAWASVVTYNGTTWNATAMWTNLGNGSFNKLSYSGWGIKAGDKYIAGDFDGDGFKNELLCIQGNGGQYATILQANPSTMNFDWMWSNNGSGHLDGWGISADNKFINGDFDSDGKFDDLLCVQGAQNGWWAVLSFNLSPFGFQWVVGGQVPIGTWNIGSADQFITGDFDGNGYTNEILCLDGANTNSAMLKLTGFTWTTEWINTTGNISGWGRSSGDKIIAGNIDADLKDEVMCIQNAPTSGWATTFDLNSSNNGMVWNWSNHNNTTGLDQNYIGNWAVKDPYALDVKYIFLKPVAGQKKQLLAFKDYGCGNYLISMFTTNYSTPYRLDNSFEVDEGLNANEESYFKVFPNPNQGSFTVAVENGENKTIIITDILGYKIYGKEVSEREFTINLESYSKGMYFVTLIDGSKVFTRKVILE